MQNAFDQGKRAAFLAVEDARILGGKIERLDILRECGVKYLTLLWGGKTCIGSSHDTDGGLTDFGFEVVRKCLEIGILPDISHANEQVTDEVAEIALEYGKPFIASHSNCYEVFPHTRNLRKKHLDTIIKLGGSVGISLCTPHLCGMNDGKVYTAEDIFAHIDGYMCAGAEDVLGLGCDLDGTDLPCGFSGVEDLYKIADVCLSHGYSEGLIEKIFYKNFYSFLERNF
jgi:membrane dipeptidase